MATAAATGYISYRNFAKHQGVGTRTFTRLGVPCREFFFFFFFSFLFSSRQAGLGNMVMSTLCTIALLCPRSAALGLYGNCRALHNPGTIAFSPCGPFLNIFAIRMQLPTLQPQLQKKKKKNCILVDIDDCSVHSYTRLQSSMQTGVSIAVSSSSLLYGDIVWGKGKEKISCNVTIVFLKRSA